MDLEPLWSHAKKTMAESFFVAAASSAFRSSLQCIVSHLRDRYNIEVTVQELADVVQLPASASKSSSVGAFITPQMSPSPAAKPAPRARAPAKRKTEETHTKQCSHTFKKGEKAGSRCVTMIPEEQEFCSTHRPSKKAPAAKASPITVTRFESASVPEAVFVSLDEHPGMSLHPVHKFVARGADDNWEVVGVLDQGSIRVLTDAERATASFLRYTVDDSAAELPKPKAKPAKKTKITPEPKTKPTPEPEPKAKSTPEPEPKTKTTPEPEPKTKSTPEPEPKVAEPDDDDLSAPITTSTKTLSLKPKLPTSSASKGIEKLQAMAYKPRAAAVPVPAPAAEETAAPVTTARAKLSLKRN